MDEGRDLARRLGIQKLVVVDGRIIGECDFSVIGRFIVGMGGNQIELGVRVEIEAGFS